jgi:selenocysteine-specific elongation factor
VSAQPAALTLGTAGHIDHGKTALVRALTGVDTDRLPQEKARGMSIELGFAPLALPGGRRVSVVDVPGHERFVRTMVAGASGIDFHLMVIAADDGVMPQTLEHAEVLDALGIDHGVVAITKCDRASPRQAAAEAAELLPGAEVVACSARTGDGVADVAAALARVADRLTPRGNRRRDGPAVLHIDRAFTIHGAGTVVTGTLWSGTLAAGDTLALLPARQRVRVRSLQVHDEPADRAHAGQRVALNLAGLALRDVARGDALADPAAALAPTQVVDAALDLRDHLRVRRVMAHHGTRAVPARLVALGDGLWQLRLEAPLIAAAGDRLVVRSVAPPDTLGGGTVLDPRARRHGRRP